VIADPAISLLCGAMVTDLSLNPGATAATRAHIMLGGRSSAVTARRFAIAGGGLKSTRLLLSIQRRHADLFGGADGPLGRAYAGHLTGSIANIVLTSPQDFAHLDLRLDNGTYVRRRFTISAAAQTEHRLLNTAFYLGNPPYHDYQHRSGTLSALFLAMRLPVLGRRLASAETHNRNRGAGWRTFPRHAGNSARQPVRTVRDLTGIVRRRLVDDLRMNVFVVPNARGVYALQFHAEQTCHPDNRVDVIDRRSTDGLAGVQVSFQYSAQDIDSVVRAHELLDDRLRATGRGYLSYHQTSRHAAVHAQAGDGFHQIGSTRMSDDLSTGVVDKDCKVHRLSNVYVASSSVFPTAGEANPTFAAVCLAVRLAHHLASAANP
jgi:choline dehydrogenase-like flavoprotein